MWCVSAHTAQAHLSLITSRGCGIVPGSTGTQTSKSTLTKGAARSLMFLQKGIFKWVSRYCKTESSLFLCPYLSVLICLFFSFQEVLCLLHMPYMAYRLHSWFWWSCFPLDPIISCDHFSWISLFGTKAIFSPVDQNPGWAKPLQTNHLHCCWSCLEWTKWPSGCL